MYIFGLGLIPRAEKGFKYGNKGLHSQDSLQHLELPAPMSLVIAELLNHSLAAGTWSSYRTVGNLLGKCQAQTATIMDFPLTTRSVIIFVHWLFETRKVTSNTANSYLSGLRYLHLLKGVDIPVLRPVIIEQLIKGKKNLENIEKRQNQKPVRAPVTLTSMKLLKIEIKNWNSSRFNKAMVWTVCTTAFAGCLRIHELLCKKVDAFDPDFTLLKSDIKLNKTDYKGTCIKVIQLRLKSPKEDRVGKGKIIDVYESEGPLCPVRAMERWSRLNNQTGEDLPAFRWEDGKCFTGKQLNKLLRRFLEPHLDYKQMKISSHSFRAGMATLLGTLGFGDEEIMAMGRWSSDAYLNYLKLPRTRRIEMAKKVAKSIN